jgi:uncharacterized SAM-binding protein YcdF (DUF218 family)
MDDGFHWRMLFKALLLPPTAPLLIAVIGLVIWRRHPRSGRALTATGVIALLLLSLPVVASMLIRAVDDSPPLDFARGGEAQAIVMLRYGARVARELKLPVLVSGGRASVTLPTEAMLMQAALQGEYGIAVRWIEDRSINTHQNAVMSAAILRADGVRRIVLVAHGFDMPRATAEFAAAGLEAIPAPTGILAPHYGAWMDYVPSVDALQGSYYALYELFANAVLLVSRL